MPHARVGWLGSAIVLFSAAMFGTLGVASRLAYDMGMEPFAFVAWRAGVGAIGVWLVISLLRRGELLRQLWSIDAVARRWLLLAVLLGAGLNLAAFLSFANTTVALALLGFYTYPAMVAAGSVLLGREPLDAGRVLALGLALAGMAAVVLGSPSGQAAPGDNALGIALALAAAGFQTAFVLASRGYARIPAEQAMGTILAGGAVVAIVVSLLVSGPGAIALPLATPDLLVLMLAVGLFAAGLPSVLFLTGIRWIGGVRTGILMLFEPVVGVALAAIVLAERLQPLQVAGGATILLAALIVQRGIRSARADTEPGAVLPAPGGP